MRITLLAPDRPRCGVADYSRLLLHELQRLVEVVHVADPLAFRAEMNRVDLVHIQHQYFLFGGVAPWRNRFPALLRRLRPPAVLTAHEFVEPVGGPARRAAIRLVNRLQFCSPRVRRILVHTEADRDRMAAQGFDASRLRVVRHGVPRPPRLEDREEARRLLGVEDRFVVVLFGFLSRRKGHLLAVEAMERLDEAIMLVLAGGRHPDDRTDFVSGLEARVAASPAGGRIRVTGYLAHEEMLRVLSAADLVVAPFTESSGSGSLAWALACGKPILASDIGPHREIVAQVPGALALARPSPDALAEAIGHIRADASLRTALAQGAAAYAVRHTYARAAEETVEVYQEVIREGSG